MCCPVPNIPKNNLRPLLVKDGGNYSCVVEVMLRNIKECNVSDYTVVRCEFHKLSLHVHLCFSSSLICRMDDSSGRLATTWD